MNAVKTAQNKAMENILITGATGNFGGLTINYLLEKGIEPNSITALVRDDSKASELIKKNIHVKVGDYNHYQSLLDAFHGIDKILLVSGTDVELREKQHENVINAAKQSGVKHIVYTSFQRKNETEDSPIALVASAHISTEKHLKESGMFYTIMRNNLYLEMLPVFMGDDVIESGVIYLPAGTGKVAYTLREDMARTAGYIISTGGHENKEYSITNDHAWSYKDIAVYLSTLKGKPIEYASPTKKEYIKLLLNSGVPKEAVDGIAGFAEAMSKGEFDHTASDIEKITGKKPVTIKQYLKQVYS